MAISIIPSTASSIPETVVALREHAALVRALLDELDRVVPSHGANAHGDVLGAQLIEELAQLGYRILECTATMTHASAKGEGR